MFRLDKVTRLVKKRKRVGRGGSRGGTSGKGNKGQNARSGGGSSLGFEGGQMPLHRRLPKRGFTNARFKLPIKIVNLAILNNLFEQDTVITKNMLSERKIIKLKKGKEFLLKVLGDGVLNKRFKIFADCWSSSAKIAIEKAGGTIEHLSTKE
jgi:large subunit ribosomal protein L15